MSRQITIMDFTTNCKVVLNSEATTFGQLKEEARNAGINIENKDWIEGISQTTPVSDNSILPTNLTYKGKPTTSLVYSLSDSKSHIKLGAMTRKEILGKIKEYGLATFVNSKEGTNYTRVKSDILMSYINDYESVHNKEYSKEDKPCEENETCENVEDPYKGLNETTKEELNKEIDEVLSRIDKELKNVIKNAIPSKVTKEEAMDKLNSLGGIGVAFVGGILQFIEWGIEAIEDLKKDNGEPLGEDAVDDILNTMK